MPSDRSRRRTVHGRIITGVSSPEYRSGLNDDPHTSTGAEGAEGPLSAPLRLSTALPTPPRPRALINAINRSNKSWTDAGGVCRFLAGFYAVSNAAHSAPPETLDPPVTLRPPPQCLHPAAPWFFCFRPAGDQCSQPPDGPAYPKTPPRDISVPWGPFLGCVRLSLQILPSHDLWWHLCTCFLNFNGCRAQAHVKLNFISISSAGPSLGPALEGAETSCAEKRTGCIPQSRSPASTSNIQAHSRLSPPPPPLLLSLCLHLSPCLGPPLLLPPLYPWSPNE